MERDTSLTELVDRHRRGDAEAAAEIYAHYASQLSRLAKQHLSDKIAARISGEDVVQSAFRTFFHRTTKGEFQIDSRAQLWRLLVKITVTKARQAGRHHTAAKRDARVEQTSPAEDWFLAAPEPGPEEAAILVDEIAAILHGLPESYAEILEMRLAGHSVAEIAERISVSRQTIYRALELLRQRVTQQGE